MNSIACYSLLCLLTMASQVFPADTEKDSTSSLEITLQGYGVDPSLEGIRTYLKSLSPTPESRKRTSELISLLSHPKFEIRENATQELMLLPSFDSKIANDVMTAGDPETTFRIKAVIAFRKSGSTKLQRVVFDYVVAAKLKGLARNIIQIRERILDNSIRKQAFRALEASVIEKDFSLLKAEFLANKQSGGGFAASCLRGMQQLNPDDTTQTILEQHDRAIGELARLEAAKILAQNERSECLDWFVSLLDAQQRACRSRSFFQLKQMTEKDFEYSASAKGEKLAASISQWQAYIATFRDEIEIQFQPRSKRLGRMLICNYESGDICSYDENGELCWSAKGSNAFTCQGLPNGNCLVMLYSEGTLREYDERGKLVKELANLPRSSSGIQRLENGNTILASGQGGGEIVEIDGNGEKVWSVAVDGMPTGARLQENGLIVAALFKQQKIIEIDRGGVVQNEFKVKGQAYTVNVTANDTFLVAFSDGGVAEYSRSGDELWRTKTAANTYWAEKLDDGTVVTADSTGVLRIDPNGKVTVLNDKFKNYTYVSSY